MLLTPMDIHNKEFKRSFRGYNEDEIDEFLDQVVNDYERLYRENDQLKKDLERSRQANTDYVEREQTIKDTLVMAQKTAEEVTKSAKESAQSLKETTARECQNLRRQTDIDCREAHHRAEDEARRIVSEAKEKVRIIVAEYDRLVREKNAYLMKVRTSLAQELAVIDQTMQELPDPAAADQSMKAAEVRTQQVAERMSREEKEQENVPQASPAPAAPEKEQEHPEA